MLYREASADSRIAFGPGEAEAVATARVLHIGSLLLTSPAGRETFRRAIQVAHDNAVLVSTDVNLRERGWESVAEMRASSLELIKAADIVKVTATELAELDLDLPALQASGQLWLITDGARESLLVRGSTVLRAAPRPVPVVDTTGAGDASFAALLGFILGLRKPKIAILDPKQLSIALGQTIAAGEAAVQRAGAMVSPR